MTMEFESTARISFQDRMTEDGEVVGLLKVCAMFGVLPLPWSWLSFRNSGYFSICHLFTFCLLLTDIRFAKRKDVREFKTKLPSVGLLNNGCIERLFPHERKWKGDVGIARLNGSRAVCMDYQARREA
jgi:hypothetical protein